MTYQTAILKRNIELVCMYPFVVAGKIAGHLFPLKNKHTIFLFFSSADIGGSIKVNIDITECVKKHNPIIIFSKKPKNNQFLYLFEQQGVRILDLHKYIDNKLYHFVNFFFRGVLSSWINQTVKPVVFGGECLFFYKVIPHVKKETKTIELCHMKTWFNFSLAFIDYMDCRIFSTPQIKRDVEEQYRKNNLPQLYFDKLRFIDNKINIPPLEKVENAILQVLFVGRGAPQKRVYLIAEIAKQMHLSNKPVHFSFVGDVETIIPPDIRQYCTLYGPIKKAGDLDVIYKQSDVLILTSAYEGLPIVVMDMMARGKIVVSTAVDGIPDYITHLFNGLLIYEVEEYKIIQEGIKLLSFLIDNPEVRKTIGQNSYNYTLTHFSEEIFNKAYEQLLINDKQP